MKQKTPWNGGSYQRFRHGVSAALLIILGTIALIFTGCSNDSTAVVPQAQWYAGWRVAQLDYNEATPDGLNDAAHQQKPPMFLENQTIRQIIHLSAGGDGLRIKLSNLFGEKAVVFDSVHIASSLGGGQIAVDTDRAVTFDGQNKVVVAAGQEVWSDTVPMVTTTNMDLSVSIYLAGNTQVTTWHAFSYQTNYLTSGNAVSAAALADTQTVQSNYWLAGVDISGTEKTSVVVTFGDSITDGFKSTADKNLRYPNQLDTLLQAGGTLGRASVVNSGIAGNRWLNNYMGPNGVSRFQRDALDITGATHLVILLGINDLGMGAIAVTQSVTADQITTAMSNAVASAKARGVKVLLATLLPYKGAFYYSDAGEAKRQVINAWIRANKQIDALVDFDKAMQDPQNTTALLPVYDSGDHLHPNDAGYLQMVKTVSAALAGLAK